MPYLSHVNDHLSPLNTQGSPITRKRTTLSLSLASNFEAFSLHFHLPLKVAAEKFGVRATAFKKRCRAIGIRHWPYRKVRSLKRSLQELNRSKELGELNEKQQYQYTTFKIQLDKLMAPETYGIDPSGRIPQHSLEQDSGEDEEEESTLEDDSYVTHSPRFNTTFTECTISPIESDKTFEFSGPSHLRTHRKQHASCFTSSSSTPKPLINTVYSNDLPSMPFRSSSNGFKHRFNGYDHYLHETTLEKIPMLNSSHGTMDDHFGHDRFDSSTIDPLLTPLENHDVRPFSEDDLHQSIQSPLESTHQMDYTNERFFDDVFLQISPDYGCLV